MSDKLFAKCLQEQNSLLLQQHIDTGEINLTNKNIVKILYLLDGLYWKENKEINLDFFECLLKNGIPLDTYYSKEYETTAIDKIIRSIENDRNAENGILFEIHNKYERISEDNIDEIQELKDVSKHQNHEDKMHKMLYLLIEYGANPNALVELYGDKKITILEYADKKLFKLLVKKGANTNIEYVYKSIADLPQTPLSKAIEEHDIEIVKLLIEHNVEIDFWSYYALFQEFESYYLWNTVDKIKYNDLNSIKKSNLTLTEKVKSFEDKTEKIKIDRKFDELFEILKLHIEYKMYINCTFRHKSIFDLAIEAADYKTIEFFLENKIDELEKVEMIDTNNLENNSENLYDFANSMIKHQDKRKLEDLEKNRKLEDELHLKKYFEDKKNKPSVSKALSENDIEQFKSTITKEIAEFLPITDLIKGNYSLEFIQISIESGSDINFQDNNGKTVLILACELNKIDIVKYLLTKNIDLNIEDTNLKKAIQYVKDYELIKLFLVSLKKQHQPQKLVKLLSNFTIDKPIKYTTHDWDFGELKKEYGDFDGYMNAVKKQFDTMKNELEELSPNLYKKIYNFLIEENPDENYSWCSKTHINIGWSSLIGLKEHCNTGNKPDDFILPIPIFYEGNDLTTFKDVINLFKQEIEIRENFKNLEKLFTTQKNKLGTGRSSIFNLDLSTAKLNRQFYTDVEKFSNVLDRIFGEIKIRTDFPNIEVITTELEDRSIEIIIVQIDSISNKSASDLLKEIEDGDFAEIKLNLTNLCDWSIENSFENESFRINFLHSNNVKEIVSLDEKPNGFTHILRFYK